MKMEERRNRRDRVDRYRSERDGRRNNYSNREDRGYRGGRDGNRFFGMEKKRGRDEKNSSRQIKTLPQNSGKKKENKISITEYKKRFKF